MNLEGKAPIQNCCLIFLDVMKLPIKGYCVPHAKIEEVFVPSKVADLVIFTAKVISFHGVCGPT